MAGGNILLYSRKHKYYRISAWQSYQISPASGEKTKNKEKNVPAHPCWAQKT
jgi:hypothetical protein